MVEAEVIPRCALARKGRADQVVVSGERRDARDKLRALCDLGHIRRRESVALDEPTQGSSPRDRVGVELAADRLTPGLQVGRDHHVGIGEEGELALR